MNIRRFFIGAMAFFLILGSGALASDEPGTSPGDAAASLSSDSADTGRAAAFFAEPAVILIEYGEAGCTLTRRDTEADTLQLSGGLTAPGEGEDYVLEGLRLVAGPAAGTGLVIDAGGSENGSLLLGGELTLYEAPDGWDYNSLILCTPETGRGTALAVRAAAVTARNVYLDGDIVHEASAPEASLSMQDSTLRGAVVSVPAAETAQTAGEAPSEASGDMKDETAAQGLQLSLNIGSVWTVTGDSCLGSLTVADTAALRNAAAIYADCVPGDSELLYDWTTGTKIEALEIGRTYKNVVVLAARTQDDSLSLNINGLPVAAVDVTGSAADSVYSMDVKTLLELFGLDLSYDEESGTLSLQDSTGLMGALLDGSAD